MGGVELGGFVSDKTRRAGSPPAAKQHVRPRAIEREAGRLLGWGLSETREAASSGRQTGGRGRPRRAAISDATSFSSFPHRILRGLPYGPGFVFTANSSNRQQQQEEGEGGRRRKHGRWGDDDEEDDDDDGGLGAASGLQRLEGGDSSAFVVVDDDTFNETSRRRHLSSVTAAAAAAPAVDGAGVGEAEEPGGALRGGRGEEEDGQEGAPREGEAEEKIFRRAEGSLRGALGPNAFGSAEAEFVSCMAREFLPESDRCFSQFTAGPGALVHGRTSRQRADLALAGPTEEVDGRRGRYLAFFQYHSSYYHLMTEEMWLRQQERPPPGFGPPEEEDLRREGVRAHRRGCPKAPPGGGVIHHRDEKEDAEKARLAAALSEAAAANGIPLRFSYVPVFECDIKCSFGTFKPSSVGSRLEAVPTRSDGSSYSSMGQLLRERHPETTLRGSKQQPFTQSQIVRRILRPGSKLNGFLVIRGGETVDSGGLEDTIGYCLQRGPIYASDLGDFTRWQIAAESGFCAATAAKRLRDFASSEHTVLRSSFRGSSCETLSMDLFRFLCEKRKLHSYEILHVVLYEVRTWINGFLLPLMEKRHLEKKFGGSGSLMEQSLKLAQNTCVWRKIKV